MFKLLDVVRLKKEDKELGIKTSYIGAIVDIHADGEAYTVEFIDENHETIEAALFVDFTPDKLELVD